MRAATIRLRPLFRARCPLLLGLLGLLGACAEPPSPVRDLRLLERFVAESGVAEERSVEIAGSTRRALVTDGGTTWRLDGPDLRGRDLVFGLAAPRSGGPVAIVETVGESAGTEIFRAPVEADAGWVEHRVAIPAGTAGLRLRSEGPGAVAWAGLFADAETRTEQERDGERPDLVLVLIDTLRADHLSSYGYARQTSPALDRLAEESIRFERSFSASTWTLPSTATLLTGLLPNQHGARRPQHRLDPELPTVAGRLAAAGYRTVAITDGGFVAPKWGFAQGFDRFDSTGGEAHAVKDVAPIVAEARRFLEQNRFHPYFLVLHTYETHKPYVDPEGFAGEFLAPDHRGRFRRGVHFSAREPGRIDESELQRVVDFYDGEIRRADHYLGRWLDDLRATGRWDSTAIVVTSDHGEEFREHGDFGHGFGKVFDPNVAVPLILKPPGASRPRVVGAPATGLDVAPTLLRLAGLEPHLPGRDLLESPQERALLIRGINSFADLREDRLRLDAGEWTIVQDRIRDRSEWFRRSEDPALARPGSDVFGGPAAEAAVQLAALQAWLDRGSLLVRLPEDWTLFRIPPGSRIEPVALWTGFERRRLTAPGEPIELEPGVPSFLVFLPGDGEGWNVERLAPDRETVAFGSSRPGAWDPFLRPPPFATVLPAARMFEPSTHELSPAETAELEALGYL